MNKIILLLALFLSAQPVYSQNSKVRLYEDLVYIQKGNESSGKFYIKDSTIPFTGIAYDESKDGKYLFRTKEYKDGLPNGKDIGTYYNGTLEFEFYYKNGKLDGVGKSYDRDGKILFHAEFNKGDTVKILVDKMTNVKYNEWGN